MASTAQNIANQVAATFANAGTPLSDDITSELPAVTQLFIVLSKPVRNQVRAFLSAQTGKLKIAKATAVSQSLKANGLATKINALGGVVTAVLAPLDRTMNSIALDSVLKASPTLARLLKSVGEVIPIEIPSTVATTIAQVGGFDFFAGINSYRDLRDKIDELTFRAARATALSTYSQTASFLVDQELNKIEAWIEIIDTLDVTSAKEITVSPSSIAFGSVAVGSIGYSTLTISNSSTGPGAIHGYVDISGTGFSLVGVSNFSLVQAGGSLSISIQFSPTVIGSITGTLSVVHDAANISSPVSVSLSGIGV